MTTTITQKDISPEELKIIHQALAELMDDLKLSSRDDLDPSVVAHLEREFSISLEAKTINPSAEIHYRLA